MPIKESSDEMNATLVAPVVVKPPAKRTPKDYVALAIATCGVGFIPIAPGTWGSAVGVALYLLLRWFTLLVYSNVPVIGLHKAPVISLVLLDRVAFLAIELTVITFVTLIGIWAASRAEQILQKKDPGQVVIDEVAGQLIALLPVPLMVVGPWRWLILVAFFLFRAFDIMKPYPVRRLEALESGLGIVVDDLAAGAYAAVFVSIFIFLFAFFQYLPDVF